jgi:hypothetical protein
MRSPDVACSSLKGTGLSLRTVSFAQSADGSPRVRMVIGYVNDPYKVDNLVDCRIAASDPRHVCLQTRGEIAYLQQEEIACVNT